jgi:acyl-CoA thioester hydrolase
MLPFEHETLIRVRYSETDQMGVVWHGNYLQYFETGRTEALRECGWAYRGLEAAGIMLPLVEAQLAYLRPAKYDDLLTVKTIVREPATSRLRFEYEVRNEAGDLLVTGSTVLGFVDAATRRPCRPPARLREIFS